jgi:hypothetical protein
MHQAGEEIRRDIPDSDCGENEPGTAVGRMPNPSTEAAQQSKEGEDADNFDRPEAL